MRNSGSSFFSTRNIVYVAILTALLVVLNLLSTVFKIVTNINFTLIPIVLSALLMGVKGGALLGLISGLMTFIFGVTGVDPFTNFLFVEHPVLTFLTCTLKTTAGGALGGFVYGLLKGKRKYVGTFIASAVVPVVNTGIFIIGALTMYDAIAVLAGGTDVIYFLIIVCAGVNFLIELAVNVILAPMVFRIVDVIETRIK